MYRERYRLAKALYLRNAYALPAHIRMQALAQVCSAHLTYQIERWLEANPPHCTIERDGLYLRMF